MDAPDDLIREILDRAGVVWMQEDDPELPAMPSDDAFNVERGSDAQATPMTAIPPSSHRRTI